MLVLDSALRRGRFKMWPQVLLLVVLCAVIIVSGYTSRDLRCLVCQVTVEELEKEIHKINPTKQIKVGGYRLDDKGHIQQRSVPLARSQMHLSELMDGVCDKMDNYVRATYKTSGELTLLKLMTNTGGMNPNISKVDIIQDSDLNKSLKFYCEGIVEEFEEEFYRVLGEDGENADIALCAEVADLCDLEPTEEYNFEDKDEL